MKKVLITWWNKGIWLEITKLFLFHWYYVIVIARDFSNFSLNNSNLKKIEFDLTKNSQLEKICSAIWKIDILINNAWVLFWLEYEKYSEYQINYILQLNLLTPIKLIENFLKTNTHLRVVNTSSLAWRIWDDDLYYAITKAWIINMTKSFARKKWPHWLIINSVNPGPIDNSMLNLISKERKESIPKISLSWKYNNSINVAKTIFWLANDAPNTINWCSIDINDWLFFN